MKKYFKYILLSVASSLLLSCSYGPQHFLGRFPTVDQRSGTLIDVTDKLNTELSSSTQWNKTHETQWRFFIITDSHYGKESNRPEEALFQSIKDQEPDFIIMPGDLTETGSQNCYDELDNFITKLREVTQKDGRNIPDIAVLGNHDVYNDGWQNWQKSRKENTIEKGHSFFKFTTTAKDGSEEFNRTWYFLDSANSTLGNTQLNALKSDLVKNPNKKFVFTHYPFFEGEAPMYDMFRWTNTYERAMLFDAFDKAKVNMVFTGHWHAGGITNWGSFYELVGGSFILNGSNLNHWYCVTVDEKARSIEIIKYTTRNGDETTLNKNTTTYSF